MSSVLRSLPIWILLFILVLTSCKKEQGEEPALVVKYPLEIGRSMKYEVNHLFYDSLGNFTDSLPPYSFTRTLLKDTLINGRSMYKYNETSNSGTSIDLYLIRKNDGLYEPDSLDRNSFSTLKTEVDDRLMIKEPISVNTSAWTYTDPTSDETISRHYLKEDSFDSDFGEMNCVVMRQTQSSGYRDYWLSDEGLVKYRQVLSYVEGDTANTLRGGFMEIHFDLLEITP